jgi:Leucine-rich repeat (LRR) protein
MIGLLTSLGELNLEANALTSTLPEELGSLSLLFALSFKGNDFDSSPFPTLLLQLTELRSLLLSELSLSGTLPAEIASLQELRELDLSHNSLTGPLPTSLLSLLNLQRLLLGENKFNGTIPSEIGSLSQINGISIEKNNFSGALPTEIGLLSSLKTFAFSYNQFSGLMSEYLCSIGQTLETFGDYLECTYLTVDDFYGGLQCPSAECCYNCPMAYSG